MIPAGRNNRARLGWLLGESLKTEAQSEYSLRKRRAAGVQQNRAPDLIGAEAA
jgi:hypothetical protein